MMNKRFIVAQILLTLVFALSMAINSFAQSEPKTNQANYIIAKHVIGSGGVMGATGTNHFHSATAGEIVVGGTQGTNNILLSGYWHTCAFGPSGIEQKEILNVPQTFELHQNYPNPFNPQTTIEYELPDKSRVTVEILNLVGQRIRLLMNSQEQAPGFMQVVWDGSDDQRRLMGSGVYIYRVSVYPTDNSDQKSQILYQQSKKMLFVK